MSRHNLRPRRRRRSTGDDVEMESAAGVRYRLPHDARGNYHLRAEQGFQAVNIRFTHLEQQSDAERVTFAFNESIRVSIGSSDGRSGKPECSCGAEGDGTPCKHIFWLTDQIAQQMPHEDRIPIAPDASKLDNVPVYKIIEDYIGLQKFVQLLTQYNVALPDSPAPDDVATLRALRSKAFNVFRAFEAWVVYGPSASASSAFASNSTLDVAGVADEVGVLVVTVRERCEEQRSQAMTHQAIELLCDLLAEIFLWDKDAHAVANASWRLESAGGPSSEGPDHPCVNLYTRLMRRAPRAVTRPSGASVSTGIFETLNQIGHELLADHADRLRLLVQRAQRVGASAAHAREMHRLLDKIDGMGQTAAAGRLSSQLGMGESSSASGRRG